MAGRMRSAVDRFITGPDVRWWRRLTLQDRLSLRAQLVLVTALLASAVAIGLVVVVQFSMAGAANSATEQVLDDRANALIHGIDAASTKGSLVVPVPQLDPGVVVYDDSGQKVAGSVPESMEDDFEDISMTTTSRVVEGGEHFAILATPFVTSSGLRGVAVIPEPLGPYERREQTVLIVTLVAGALLVLMAAGSAAWISKRVLAPVQQMARTADEWSEHDLDRRFALGPPTNEVRALGNTLDGLLSKVATVIQAEQRLTSELAHELRTPLTTIRATAELLTMRNSLDAETHDDLTQIKSACDTMANTINVLLDIARRNSLGARRDRTHLEALEAALRDLPSPQGEVDLDFSTSLFLDVPQELAVRAIAPVLDNALRMSNRVQLSARPVDHLVEILVADTGPGVEPEHVDLLFTPGHSARGGSGLGLSLARRVARSGGGDVTLLQAHNHDGGATFSITFPGGNNRT